jgi:pectate lyase
MMLILGAIPALSQQPAFPGAEGGGMYTRGGRGGKVLEVISLADDGSVGTLRWAVNQTGARTVVFRVSGTIALNSELKISRDSITIAGQTAPGDGICLRKYPLSISANEVIVRFVRVRLGDESGGESDAISGMSARHHIIIDHCSVSWSIDEALSVYGNDYTTVQWCIISESMYHSTHPKGNHGYGGIWGGKDHTSFHHNLLAHHSSRTPRLSGGETSLAKNTDLRNNVIYNWGFNSAYGGEGGTGNFVNNYYKPGPATKSGVRSRIFQPSDTLGRWFIDGNIVDGNAAVSANNWAGGVNPSPAPRDINTIRATAPFPYERVTTHTASEAFDLVLQYAGASLPVRDTIDRRIVHETRTGTAICGGRWWPISQGLDTTKFYGIIDKQTEAGGWPMLNTLPAPTDNDHDGMPDAWESANGLDPNNSADRNNIGADGYTMLEKHLNSLVPPMPGTTDVRRHESSNPEEPVLYQNYPNPFNPKTAVSFQLSAMSFVDLRVYDVLGREVATLVQESLQPGTYLWHWNASGLPSGVYFYRMQYNGFVDTKKMILTK